MTHDQMAWLAARLRDKSARFRKHADFLLNSVPGDPINNAAAKGLTADSDDFDHAADLIESMAQRVPLSEEQIYQVIEAARESYRAHTTGIRGQMLTIYDDMDWHLVRAVEQAHGIRSEE